MLLFIRGLPRGTSRSELIRVVQAAVRVRFPLPFRCKRRVARCEILQIVDKSDGRMERHGLVDVVPERAARLALKRLNHSRIRGKLVEVHLYRKRSYQRDRRIRRFQDYALEGERRVKDRRRSNVVIAREEAPRVVGLTGFDRLHEKP